MKRLKRNNALLIVLGALAITAGVVGCGGSEARELSTASVTRAEFNDQVEAICAHGRREALGYRPPGEAETEREALAAAIHDILLPAISEAVGDIYALGAPADQRKRTETLLVALQRAVDRGEALDAPTVEQIEELFAPAGRLARRAGLVSCAYG